MKKLDTIDADTLLGIPALVKGVAVTACIYLAGALASLGYTQTMVKAAQKVLFDIRRDLFAHLQTLPCAFSTPAATAT